MNQPAAPAPLPAAPEGFVNVFVDGTLLHVKKGSTVMQACTQAEKEIPHFCYHDRLSIAGNCRMCLVEIEGMPKPVASCHWPVAEGMKVRTDSKITIDARKGTMEFLLINHPLDCPICDQGGECELQDQALGFGADRTHYHEFKRAVDDKEIGSKIKTVMTRCIHCTRCVRFATEIAGVEEFGATGRGENMQVGTYVEQALQSELAGNMIDLCPVGALTSKPYAYTARPWELARVNGIDVVADALGSHITIDTRAGQVMRVLPRECNAINEEWLSDAARFSYDALNTNRLDAPRLKGKPSDWQMAFAAIKEACAGVPGAKIAALTGQMHSTENYTAFNRFASVVLETPHLDARPAGSILTAAHPHTLSIKLADFDSADAVLLVGVNPRREAPLLNVRLRRAALKRRVPVGLIGESMDLTYPHQHLGTSPADLQKMITTKNGFMDVLKKAQRPVVLVGEGAFARNDAQALLAEIAALSVSLKAEKGWNVLSVLPRLSGSVGALRTGVLPGEKGHDTADMLKNIPAGKYSVAVLYGETALDETDVKAAVKAGTFCIYIGTHNTAVAKACSVVLPAAAWSEQPGSYFNAEGLLQDMPAAVKPPLQAKEDWKIFRALSEVLGKTLPFDTLAALRATMNKTLTAKHPQPEVQAGRVTGTAFKPAVEEYYLSNPYLQQSATMHKQQAEAGQARIRKAA